MKSDQLQAPESTSGTLVRINPNGVVPSIWNGFDFFDVLGKDFERLKSSIQDTGGNLQPVKVRPALTQIGPDARGKRRSVNVHEIVYGHSRLHACHELGLPVLAIVEDLSDVQAAEQFAVEFWWSKRWRPLRMCVFVQRVLDGGMYPSMRRAAQGLRLDLEDVSILYHMASWPDPLRRALQYVDFTRAHAKRISRFDRETLASFTEEGLPWKKRTAAMVLRKLETSTRRA